MPVRSWQLQEAKAKFSEMLDTAERKGPQLITRRGADAAVIVPIAEWKRLKDNPPSSPQTERTEQQRREDFLALLRSGPAFEIPDRHRERLEERKRLRLARPKPRKQRVFA